LGKYKPGFYQKGKSAKQLWRSNFFTKIFK